MAPKPGWPKGEHPFGEYINLFAAQSAFGRCGRAEVDTSVPFGFATNFDRARSQMADRQNPGRLGRLLCGLPRVPMEFGNLHRGREAATLSYADEGST